MPDNIPEAIATPRSRFSVVWIIPLLALLLGGWLTFKYLQEKGLEVRIEFPSAEGLVAGKSKIKYKDVIVGEVDEIEFSGDLKSVIVSATIDRNMRAYLTDSTRFWVVHARVAAGEIRGLNTLLGGAYIGMQPGDKGKEKIAFEGLASPPVLFTEEDGSRYRLTSPTLYSFDTGAPVYYRRLKVGEVISYELDKNGEQFNIEIFIRKPYDRFVHENTLFWNAGGVDLKLGAEGFKVQTQSLVSLLLGGIAFDTLDSRESAMAAQNSEFTLYANHDVAMSTEFKRGDRRYRLYFDGSARGLAAGAPVTLRGIKVGSVTDVRLEFDARNRTFKIPVTIEFEPGRFSIIGDGPDSRKTLLITELVEQGLRAQLRTGNIITGQMLVDLDIYPDAKPAKLETEGEYLVLPTIPTTIDSLMISLNGFLEKVSKMPLDEIGINLNGVLEGVNTLVHSDDITSTLGNIRTTTELLNDTLKEVQNVAAGYDQKSDVYQALLRTMHELSGATRSLRQMAEYLERHPEALLKGKAR